MDESARRTISQLFHDYLRMYSSRDDRLVACISEDFSGFTGGGYSIIKSRNDWGAVTRQDLAHLRDPIQFELKDLAIQSLADTVAVATGFFTVYQSVEDHRETARLVLIFRNESEGWKISHSSTSVPGFLVHGRQAHPRKEELLDRNQILESMVAERTRQLSEAIETLRNTNQKLALEIDERKRASNALYRRDELQRSILRASPDDITITDTAGRILALSPQAWEIFGCTRQEDLLGRPITDFIVAEDRERALSQLAGKRDGAASLRNEFRALGVDGRTFDVELNSEYIRDAQGIPTGIVVIVRDITERKRMEAEKEKLEILNRQFQKTESLGRMASAVAHYFNNKLAVVIANLDLAIDQLSHGRSPESEIRSAVNTCYTASEMSGLMLTYLGKSLARHDPLDLSEVCRISLPMLHNIVGTDVVLEIDLPSPGPVIFANAPEVQQLLVNLITNAWEATSARPAVLGLRVYTVFAANISSVNRFPSGWQAHNQTYGCLEVTDTGEGIQKNNIEQLFDPFFSTRFLGRGMGLAVVLGIVRGHGAVITVQSEVSRGSTFQIYFPI